MKRRVNPRHASLRSEAMPGEVQIDYAVGQTVLTPDGPGVITDAQDGYGGSSYTVLLDGGLGGGEYRGNDLSRTARRYSQTPLVCDRCGGPAMSSTSGGLDGHTMLCVDCAATRAIERTSAAAEWWASSQRPYGYDDEWRDDYREVGFGNYKVLGPFASEEEARRAADYFGGVVHSTTQSGGLYTSAAADDPVEDLARIIYQRASMIEPKVSADMRALVVEQGGALEGFEHRLKSQDSIARKLRAKNRSSIGDAIRYTIVLPDDLYAVQVQYVIDGLKARGYRQDGEIENYWGRGDDYQGINSNWVIPGSDIVMELQFHTDKSLRLKEEVIHGLYEKFRTLPDSNIGKRTLFDVMRRYWDFVKVPDNVLDIGTPKAHPEPQGPMSEWHINNNAVQPPAWLRAARLVSAMYRQARTAARADLPLAPVGSVVTAADDYPELGDILWKRPDLVEVQSSGVRSLGARTATTIKELADDPNTPWWYKAIAPGLDRANNALPPEYRVTNIEETHGEPNWCRFRRDNHCWFPKELDAQATRVAGYDVWIPVDRGVCKRRRYDSQQECKIAEPGPQSGDPNWKPDATRRWDQGGQRVAVRTGAWKDVRDKGVRIRRNGGVHIIANTGLTVTAEVQGEHGLYVCTITRVPGTKQQGLWRCSCKWNQYAWARSEPWKKLEGRQCSHVYALLMEMQSHEMFGGTIEEEDGLPVWRQMEPIPESPHTLNDNVTDLQMVLTANAKDSVRLAMVSSTDHERIERLAGLLQSLSSTFPAKVRGRILDVEVTEQGVMADGVPVSAAEVLYPTWDPYEGLSYTGAKRSILAGLSIVAADEVELPDKDYKFAGLIIKSYDTGRIMLTQRSPFHGDDDNARGKWEFPGGHLEEGETALQGAMREFTEETGLDLPDNWKVVGYHDAGKYLGIVIAVENESWTTAATLLEFETMGIGWFHPDEVDGAAFVRAEVLKTDFDMVREAVLAPGTGVDEKDLCEWCGYWRATDGPYCDSCAIEIERAEKQMAERGRTAAEAEAVLRDDPEPALPVAYGSDESGSTTPFVPGDPRLGHLASGDSEGNEDIAAAAAAFLQKKAVKVFSPAEQQRIIDEGASEHLGASNTDRLDLAGTFYELSTSGDDPIGFW